MASKCPSCALKYMGAVPEQSGVRPCYYNTANLSILLLLIVMH